MVHVLSVALVGGWRKGYRPSVTVMPYCGVALPGKPTKFRFA